MSDCETIAVQGLRPDALVGVGSSIPVPPHAGGIKYTSIRELPSVADTRDRSPEIAARRAVDVVLNRLEDACPAFFQPRRPQTEHVNQVWLRVYPATDLAASVDQGTSQVHLRDPRPSRIVVGSEEAWARHPCRLNADAEMAVIMRD